MLGRLQFRFAVFRENVFGELQLEFLLLPAQNNQKTDDDSRGEAKANRAQRTADTVIASPKK